jgi:outer membrane protein assembly factor BamB
MERRWRSWSLLGAAEFALLLGAAQLGAQWRDWGGPNRNFTVEDPGLAASWPASGPRILWQRALGEGTSAIAVDGSRLYTMYRRPAAFWQVGRNDEEVVVCLDAETGKTIWEFAYPAPFRPETVGGGSGPHAMPIVTDTLVFTAGVNSVLQGFDKQTGRVLWRRDLRADFGATEMGYGYSSHPLAYKGNLIVMSGGANSALLSLRQTDGGVVWKRHGFKNSNSSPVLARWQNRDVVLAWNVDGLLAADPNDGTKLWTIPNPTRLGLPVVMPLWDGDGRVFLSSAYDGARMIKDGQILWSQEKLRVYYTTVIREGETLYASIGVTGPCPLTAIDASTGKVRWQSREFGRAHLLKAGNVWVVAGEDGTVALARLSPTRVEVLAKTRLLSEPARTPPSLGGRVLYLRDRQRVLALDLGSK